MELTNKEKKEALIEIVEFCAKYNDFGHDQDISQIYDLKKKCEYKLLLLHWQENYNISIDSYYGDFTSSGYLRINDVKSFNLFEDAIKCHEQGRGRSIAWPDNDMQPDNGWYLVLGYSTGAYIFGDDYKGQQMLFKDFWDELLNYRPDYIDSKNHYLYWKIENSTNIYNCYEGIFKKYCDRNKLEFNKRKIQKLEAEIAELTFEKNIE